jgi:hypothetical protein
MDGNTQKTDQELRSYEYLTSVPDTVNGRLDGFSTDRLFRFLNALGCDVQITISQPRPRSRGCIQVKTG